MVGVPATHFPDPNWEGKMLNEIKTPPPTDWVWEGYIARGLITELVGIWKAGKAVKKAWVCVISEENPAVWKERQRAFGLKDKHTPH